MTINEFFAQNIDSIRTEIVDNLNSPFDSHQFDQKFAQRFEADYIGFLNDYRGDGAFREVHKQIAQSLSRYEAVLGLTKTGKVRSPNIFGEITEVERWEKS